MLLVATGEFDMTEIIQSKIANKVKPQVIIKQFDDLPPAHPRNEAYDEAITQAVSAGKGTISVQIEGKTTKAAYPGLQSRIAEYNRKNDRQYDLMLAQRVDDLFIKRCVKGSLVKEQPK
jgi:hypothetical protein